MLKEHEIRYIRQLREGASEDVMFVPISKLILQGSTLYKYSDTPSEALVQPDGENVGFPESDVFIHRWSDV